MNKKYEHIFTNEEFFLINDDSFLFDDNGTIGNYVILESTKTKTTYTLTKDNLDKYFKFLGESTSIDLLKNIEKEKIQIYSDGCSLSHIDNKPGGWGSVLKKDSNDDFTVYSGSLINSDNNYMELLGVVETLKKLKSSYYIELFSDSKYVVDGINIYLKKRLQNNFKKIKNEKLKELWVEYYKYSIEHTIIAIWKPSSSQKELDICDGLAKRKALELKSNTDFNSFFN